jgi:acyl carrier protein
VVEELDADSLDLLQLIVALRDEFGIDIEEGEVKRLLPEFAGSSPTRHSPTTS